MKKVFCILGMVAAVALIWYGLSIDVPAKHVSVSSGSYAYYTDWDTNVGAQYLGGDAYNYQVEASLKAGYYSGVITQKSVTVVGGAILFFLSLFAMLKIIESEKQTAILLSIKQALTENKKESPASAAEPAAGSEPEQQA